MKTTFTLIFAIILIASARQTLAQPILICPADITMDATDCNGADVFWAPPVATSACGPVTIYYSPFQPDDHFPLATVIITVTAIDACQQITTCTFSVTVVPRPAPILTCPADIIVNADECYGTEASYPPATASYYFGFDHIYYSHELGDHVGFGTTVVEVNAIDNCLNLTTCSFTITVNDVPEATITCPQDVTVDATSCSGATVNYPPASAYYALGINDIFYTHPSGTNFPLGTTQVAVVAHDACLDIAQCSFLVTVNPPAAPQVTCPADVTIPATSCNGAIYTYTVNASSSVGINHIDYGAKGPGSMFPVGTTTVVATAFDDCGNTGSCSFNVTVTPFMTVSAGTDTSTIFGYSSTQTATRTAVVTGGTAPFNYSWTLNRQLKCNQVNNTGDELLTGGTCTNNICPTTTAAPSCSGNATINATLIADGNVCVTVTDAAGCVATDCFQITALDGRCFTGNAGKNKTKICHQTGNPNNPGVAICISKQGANNFLANHPGDYVGPCHARLGNTEDEIAGGLTFFPNPFSTTGTIRITPEEDAHAELEVFSSLGAKLPTIFSGDVYADETREFVFDGSNLTPGIYLCKLTVGSEVYYLRMALNK